MDSHVTVNIVDSGSSIPVPNTGGATMGGLSISETGIIGVGAVMLLLALVVAIIAVIKKNKGHRVFSGSRSFHINSKKRLIFGMLALFILSGALSFNVMQLAKQEGEASAIGEDIPEGFDNTLAISTSDITMDIELESKNTFAFVGNDVVVKSPTMAGYELFMYAKEPNLVNGKTGKKINSLPVGERAGDSKTPLGDDTWGFSFEKPTKMKSVNWNGFYNNLEDATLIKSVDGEATEANDATTLYFGVNLTPDFPTGTYETVITYVAIANFVEPDITFVYTGMNNPLYFDEEKTQEYNMVGFSCIGEDEEKSSQCTWMRVAGKYKKPILSEGQSLEYDGWIATDYELWVPDNEEELLEMLNDGVGDGLSGQTIPVYSDVVDSFTITYHPNGGHFERVCVAEALRENLSKLAALIDDTCVEEEVESVLRQYKIGNDYWYQYGITYGPGESYDWYHDDEELSIIGWSEDPSALVAEYYDGQQIEISPMLRGMHFDLYAVWGRRVYTTAASNSGEEY